MYSAFHPFGVSTVSRGGGGGLTVSGGGLGDSELPPVNWEYTHAMHAGGRFGMNKLKKTRAFFSSADINLGVWDQTKIYLQI